MTEKDTQFASANVTFERLRDMANDFSPTKAEAPNHVQTTPSAMPPENEIVGDLLVVARMACSDLPPDARNALRTLLLVITMLCKPGSRIDRDVKDLIEVASMACAEVELGLDDVGAQILAHRVPRQTCPPRNLPDREMVPIAPASDDAQ